MPLARDIEKVKSIQKASCKVYDALCHSCSKHSEHRTHFCLETQTRGSPESLQVQFKVAFARTARREAPSTCGPIFFIIESISLSNDKPSIQAQKINASVLNSLKRSSSGDCIIPAKKTRTVRFHEECTEESNNSMLALKSLKNLGLHQNFCDRIREFLQHSSAGLQCMGTLGEADSYRHLVYIPEKKKRCPALSLQEIITISSRQGPSVRLTLYERVHLARSLATAVLQYHATPWLRSPWRSEDILFFGAQERLLLEESLTPISEPHIDVPVGRSKANLLEPIGASTQHLASNVLLFNLGVMLIELAYMATLRNLLNKQEQSSKDSRYTEFFAARRLGEVVSREMGTKYARIVQKCVECHFASGSNLGSSELQAEYYRDVVKELEGLEDEFVSLNINS